MRCFPNLVFHQQESPGERVKTRQGSKRISGRSPPLDAGVAGSVSGISYFKKVIPLGDYLGLDTAL